MFENPTLIDREAHRAKRVKRYDRYDFAAKAVYAPLGYSEVEQATRCYPVVFSTSGLFVPVAILGTGQGSCHLADDGAWTASYIPAHIRRYPFILGERSQSSSYSLMIDQSALVDEDGEQLFGDMADGEQNLCERALSFLTAYHRDLAAAESFFAPLKDADVLVRKELRTSRNEEVIGRITGFQVVSEERLQKLPPATFNEWAASGLLKSIYRHIVSLDNIAKN